MDTVKYKLLEAYHAVAHKMLQVRGRNSRSKTAVYSESEMPAVLRAIDAAVAHKAQVKFMSKQASVELQKSLDQQLFTIHQTQAMQRQPTIFMFESSEYDIVLLPKSLDHQGSNNVSSSYNSRSASNSLNSVSR